MVSKIGRALLEDWEHYSAEDTPVWHAEDYGKTGMSIDKAQFLHLLRALLMCWKARKQSVFALT
jgi:hypothetical protein